MFLKATTHILSHYFDSPYGLLMKIWHNVFNIYYTMLLHIKTSTSNNIIRYYIRKDQ